MESTTAALAMKPHAVCVPFPAQGHIIPMLKLAKLLHHKGFHITFVNTDFNHKRLLESGGPDSLDGLSSFRFESIPDGLPDEQDLPSLCYSIRRNCLAPFTDLLTNLNSTRGSVPPVTCIVSDGGMSFTLDAAQEFGVPNILLWTASASGFMCYLHYHRLVELGYTPLKDESYLTNGYLDTNINWIPGMKNIRLRDIPSFVRTTDPDDIVLDTCIFVTERVQKATAIILNTFDSLEQHVLDALYSYLSPPVYTVGPVHLLLKHIRTDPEQNDLDSISGNLWPEEKKCLQWLDSKESDTVIYVNFGSTTITTSEQLFEFAWGLANSEKMFLWVIRPDLVAGDTAILPLEFLEETKERGFLTSWCPQESVLSHRAVGGFLTHCGWNSMLESVCGGVPMICWPFFAEQPTNCRYSCEQWGIGMEIEGDVKREKIEGLVRELMDGEKGREMKKRALEWKKLAEEATMSPGGSSFLNFNNMLSQELLASKK